ncbi:hypothetical protein E4T49_05975 [Aureobasidium sp. EXF-10728]|nr:hypothetical protein E4T49_05975 [Aureobasidium sp. EXF-10728]
MIPYSMRPIGNDDGRGWTRLSSNNMTNQSKPQEQTSPPSRYAAPNHFATPNYDMYTSPITASAGSRRSALSSYALPSPLPSTVEMQNLDPPSSASPHNLPGPCTLPTPATQPNNPRRSCSDWPWIASLLWLTLFIIAMVLHPLHFTPEPWSWTGWARPGTHELLSVKQVIFATVPKKALWGMFLAVLALDVWVLQLVYWYATVAATPTRRLSKTFVDLKGWFLVNVLVVQAILMWGWLLWSI